MWHFSGIYSLVFSGILFGILSVAFSGILSAISSGNLSVILFWCSIWHPFWHPILAFFLASILAFSLVFSVAYYVLAFYLTFYSGVLSGIHSGIHSGILFWHFFWHLFWHFLWHSIWHVLKSGSAHRDPALAVEIQSCGRRGKRRKQLWYNLETLTWQVGNNIDLKPPTMYPLHFMYMLLVYLHMSICLLFSAWTDGISHVPTFLMVFQDESDAVLRFSIFFCFWCVPWSKHGIRGMVIHPIMGVL
jgi:hypothetical protein